MDNTKNESFSQVKHVTYNTRNQTTTTTKKYVEIAQLAVFRHAMLLFWRMMVM